MAKKKRRVEIPRDLAAKVLFYANRTCCICRNSDKKVQIHHIDENPSNNIFENLATLCFDCHDETMIKGGFARKLSPEEIILYRDNWNKIVEERRRNYQLADDKREKDDKFINTDLRIVDIIINEPELAFPEIEIKLRNIGNEVVFLKKANFIIHDIGMLENPQIACYDAVPVSWNYNVTFKGLKKIAHRVSQQIKPNDVDRFTFTISQNEGDPVVPTLYYFTIELIYNEDSKILTTEPLIVPIPNIYQMAGSLVSGYDNGVAENNSNIVRTFNRYKGIKSDVFEEWVNELSANDIL